MRGLALTLGVLLLLAASSAFAAPGDLLWVRGTLLWPPQLFNEPFVVVRTDDGRVYSMDVSSARRPIPMTVRAGDRLAAVTVEGMTSYALTASAIAPEGAAEQFLGAGRAGLPAGAVTSGVEASQPAASPPTSPDARLAAPPSSSPPVAPPQAATQPASPPQSSVPETAAPQASPATAPPGREVLRLDGTVADIAAGRMQLRTSDGRQVRVDLNRVRGAVSDSLHAGDQVTVFAERSDEDVFVAVGLVNPNAGR